MDQIDDWPYVENISTYNRKVNELKELGFIMKSPVYGQWTNSQTNFVVDSLKDAGIDVRFIRLNNWSDLRFFFTDDKGYAFFLLKFSNLIRETLADV
jgi:hypothetical protein